MRVQSPTLLIVGGNDDKSIIDLNNNALNQLVNVQKKKVVTVPGAIYLFEESDMLEVARLAS